MLPVIGKIFAKVLVDGVVESAEKMEVMWALARVWVDVQVRMEVDARV